MGSGIKPNSIVRNGVLFKNWKYDQKAKALSISLPNGQSTISIKY
jgi:hypothetical protein